MENKPSKKLNQSLEREAVRPPVVVVLGHIDHGKSSLLEAIRDFKITAKESGGITQHIGAYQIEEQGRKITFLDTPGHEAFSQMRSRGAKVADIAILVIDAAEGVKTQTKEALAHIKLAGMPLIVALNKMDRPEANPEKVKRELSQEDILVESLGGKVPALEISAKTRRGIPEILELISLMAEMENLRADYDKPAEGIVIESYLDSFRGPTATLLLKEGTLKVSDIIGTSSSFVKIKSLENFQKKPIEMALPADPVIIFGFNRAPKVGEEFRLFPDMESAQKNIKILEQKIEAKEIAEGQRALNLILKADVEGSLEAILEILANLPQEKISLKILKAEAGNVNESDAKLAKSGQALILGFRVKNDPSAKIIAEREKVRILSFEIIYELIESVRRLMEKMLEPEEIRQDLGKAKILAVFLTEKNRQIVGGRVIEGEVRRGSQVEVLRNEEKIGRGKMISLQRNKREAEVVVKGDECGVLFEGDVKIETGDILNFFVEGKKKITL